MEWNKDEIYGLTNREYEGRKIIFEDEIISVLKKEYDDVPPKIGRDTWTSTLSKKYVGILRRRMYDFLKQQPMYQTYHDESEKRPKRTGTMLTRALTRPFLDELGLVKYIFSNLKRLRKLASLRDLLVLVKLEGSCFMKWSGYHHWTSKWITKGFRWKEFQRIRQGISGEEKVVTDNNYRLSVFDIFLIVFFCRDYWWFFSKTERR